ncbi:sulfate adenylyltransferase subunit 1 [Hydrogenimonas sp.]|nr:sulfate adenylyltransferase subunit 1 [Hydrogenimonas sp.]
MSRNLITENIERYLKEHENKELLRFITCGSVDDGKSTLIGRLLYDSKTVLEDQLSALKKESRKFGTTGEEIDFALLIDGLQSEREQGITIDVAYRFFATDRRKYIIADTPGHEQYTRNMVTGASTANLAIILIDARKGVLTQTRRHAYIASLLGIRHIVVAINKMDIVDYSQERFESIKSDFETMYEKLSESLVNAVGENGIAAATVDFIPISALRGDNVVERSENMPWYGGKALLEFLDSVEIAEDINRRDFRFPVQYVNRPNLDFRGFCGTIASGGIKRGDEITVLPSGKSSRVKEIVVPSAERGGAAPETIEEAFAPMAVTLTLEDEIDISRGDLIIKSDEKLKTSNTIEAMIVWMDEKALETGREYEIKRATTSLNAIFESVRFKKDVNSWEEIETDTLHLNEIGKCVLTLTREIACDPYGLIKGTGSFIVIDKITNHTVAAGMIIETSHTESAGRVYTEAEIELNAYIRKHYPEWRCEKIGN